MKAVLYCRVSDPRQGDTLSLSTQESTCRAFCEREGYAIDPRVFIDAGESAKTAQRKEFQALLTYCREHKATIHAVVVYSLSRFSRNTVDHHAFAALLRGMGIALRSATEPIDESPAGRFMEGILSAVAQFDNDTRSSRVRDGIRASRERGRWINPAPTGYLNTARRKDGPSLVVDPGRGPIVRQAFELIASGASVRSVRQRITQLGLTTRAGRALGKNTVYELLRKRVYIGELPSGERGDFEPLIPEALFLQVQQRLERASEPRRGHPKVRMNPEYPLRRFVRCGRCGAPLSGSASRGRGGRRYAFYHCLKGCVRSPRLLLEDAWLALLERVRPEPDFLTLIRRIVLGKFDDELKRARTERVGLQGRLATLEGKLRRVDDAYLHERSIDEATYVDQRDRLREAITLVKMDLGEAEIDELDVRGTLDYAEHVFLHSSALWTVGTPIGRWHLQWALFPNGLAWDGERFGTAVTSFAFYGLALPESQDSGLVDQAGIEPATS
jgi:site-specific DNA recombinase